MPMAHLGPMLRSRLCRQGAVAINPGVPDIRADKAPEPQTSLGDAYLFFACSNLTPGPG